MGSAGASVDRCSDRWIGFRSLMSTETTWLLILSNLETLKRKSNRILFFSRSVKFIYRPSRRFGMKRCPVRKLVMETAYHVDTRIVHFDQRETRRSWIYHSVCPRNWAWFCYSSEISSWLGMPLWFVFVRCHRWTYRVVAEWESERSDWCSRWKPRKNNRETVDNRWSRLEQECVSDVEETLSNEENRFLTDSFRSRSNDVVRRPDWKSLWPNSDEWRVLHWYHRDRSIRPRWNTIVLNCRNDSSERRPLGFVLERRRRLRELWSVVRSVRWEESDRSNWTTRWQLDSSMSYSLDMHIYLAKWGSLLYRTGWFLILDRSYWSTDEYIHCNQP